MNYEIEFAEEVIEDLSFLSVLRINSRFRQTSHKKDRIDKLMESG